MHRAEALFAKRSGCDFSLRGWARAFDQAERVCSGGETEVEIALREALANAIVHGNQENRRKHVHVHCCCGRDEVSIAIKDEGRGFDINKVADPTAPENTGSVHGRGIYLMKAFMNEVRFEEGGALVRMRKSARQAAAREAQKNSLK